MSWILAVPIIAVLASGTFSALSNKALYDYKAVGSCGYHGFEKPYFLTLCMFIGEAFCLLVYLGQEWWKLESSKIWASRVCCRWMYYYDADLARRRREREKEAQAHGIEPYKEDDGVIISDEEDEEKALLGGGGASSVYQPTPAHPQLQRVDASGVSSLDQDLLDLHLSEEEQRRRREASKPSKFVYLGLCLFDLSASAVGGIGLMYIDASSNQMLRGSSVVFTALLSKIILHRRLSLKQWSGIMAVVLGLALVGMCGLFRASATLAAKSMSDTHNHVSPSGALLGLVLVLSGSVLNSIQNVFEELLVKRVGSEGGGINALELVGWEGVWGTLITGLIVLPIVHYMPGSNCGSVESTVDTWRLMKNSLLIVLLVVGYTFSLSVLNAFSVILSKEVSAVFRQLINALRVVFIWLISIALFYLWTHRTMGEGWDVYSYLQLAGFALLIIGTIMYGTKENDANEDAPSMPRLDEEDEENERKEKEKRAEDLLKNKKKRTRPAKDGEAEEEEEGEVDEYDEEGNRRSKDGGIHIGAGVAKRGAGKKKGSSSVARSPGVETFPLPDVRDVAPASAVAAAAGGASSSSGGNSSRRHASIRLDEDL